MNSMLSTGARHDRATGSSPPHPASVHSRSASRSSSNDSTTIPPYAHHRPWPATARERRRGLRFRLVPWVCAAIIALLNLGSHIIAAPLVQLIERSVCRDHYAGHRPGATWSGGDVGDPLCKARKVQARVAYLVGFISTFSLVSGASLEYQPRLISSLLRLHTAGRRHTALPLELVFV
jgi:hypothetical protein